MVRGGREEELRREEGEGERKVGVLVGVVMCCRIEPMELIVRAHSAGARNRCKVTGEGGGGERGGRRSEDECT